MCACMQTQHQHAVRELASMKCALHRRDDDLRSLECMLQDQESAAGKLCMQLTTQARPSSYSGTPCLLAHHVCCRRGFGAFSPAQSCHACAAEKEELQSVLSAALSRLEAAIGAAQSQEASVACLAKQASTFQLPAPVSPSQNGLCPCSLPT